MFFRHGTFTRFSGTRHTPVFYIHDAAFSCFKYTAEQESCFYKTQDTVVLSKVIDFLEIVLLSSTYRDTRSIRLFNYEIIDNGGSWGTFANRQRRSAKGEDVINYSHCGVAAQPFFSKRFGTYLYSTTMTTRTTTIDN